LTKRNETTDLFIDGTKVSNLVYGRNYDASLMPQMLPRRLTGCVNSVVTRVRKYSEWSGVAFRTTTVRHCASAGIREPRSGQRSRLSQASRKTAQQFFSDRNFVMAAISCPERLIEFAIRKTHGGISCVGVCSLEYRNSLCEPAVVFVAFWTIPVWTDPLRMLSQQILVEFFL
jgi:hypothetical protein